MSEQMKSVIRNFIVKLDYIMGIIDKITGVVIVGLLFASFLLLFLQVILRHVIFYPMVWLEELAIYLLAYLAFWGSSSCFRKDTHIRVRFIRNYFPPLIRQLMTILANFIVVVFAYFLVRYGLPLAQLGIGERSGSGTFLLYWPRMALVTGGILILLQVVNQLIIEIAKLFLNIQLDSVNR